MDIIKKSLELVDRLLDMIDSTNPEHPTFFDSGAGSIDMILAAEAELRELKTELAHTRVRSTSIVGRSPKGNAIVAFDTVEKAYAWIGKNSKHVITLHEQVTIERKL